jgi:hypothetical protein
MSEVSQLERIERWMQAVVMHPRGAAQGLGASKARQHLPQAAQNLESVISRSRQLSALDRLGIYAEMYYLRLIEVLTAEYPTTRTVLGDQLFERACRAFVARNPSTERTLQSLSVRFPRFLARYLKGRRRARLAVDIARIERAMEDVFDAPRTEPLRYEALQKVPAGAWGGLTLRLTPALRLLELECDADACMTALRSHRPRRTPRARPCYVIVYRHNLRAWRLKVSREQFELLRLLGKGWPIGRAVYRSCRNLRVCADRLPALLSGWFRNWTAEGLFVGLGPPSQT